MNGKELIMFGMILLVSAIILFFFAEEFYNTAYRNYILSGFGGNPAHYKSQMEFWSFLKNGVSPILVFIGICLMVAGVFDLSKQSNKNSISHTIIKNRFCPNCGRAIPFDAKICPYCGNNFQTISKEDKPLVEFKLVNHEKKWSDKQKKTFIKIQNEILAKMKLTNKEVAEMFLFNNKEEVYTLFQVQTGKWIKQLKIKEK